MEDSKEGILPLVGRVIKQRLGEVKQEAARELAEGLAEFKDELREDAPEEFAADRAPPTRIEIDEA
jgi:hypothetical protein